MNEMIIFIIAFKFLKTDSIFNFRSNQESKALILSEIQMDTHTTSANSKAVIPSPQSILSEESLFECHDTRLALIPTDLHDVHPSYFQQCELNIQSAGAEHLPYQPQFHHSMYSTNQSVSQPPNAYHASMGSFEQQSYENCHNSTDIGVSTINKQLNDFYSDEYINDQVSHYLSELICFGEIESNNSSCSNFNSKCIANYVAPEYFNVLCNG